MGNDVGTARIPSSIEARLKMAAHHEAGHIVIAAAAGLRLRPEGIMVDTDAEGLACYCKEPDDSDDSRERVMLSTFAGFIAQNRFCRDHGFPELEYEAMTIFSLDWIEARAVACKLSNASLAGRSVLGAQQAVEKRSEAMVSEKWLIIEAVANALLTKAWEPVKPLKSGSTWATGLSAKYLTGAEVTETLELLGITASVVAEC